MFEAVIFLFNCDKMASDVMKSIMCLKYTTANPCLVKKKVTFHTYKKFLYIFLITVTF